MNDTNTPEKLLCIYHGNCADGFAAAWVVRHALTEDRVEFYPGKYQQDPPDVTGRDVLLVDFSYKRPVLEEMVKRANTVTVLDHHKSAEEDLRNLQGVISVFDMHLSGAMVTWNWFFPNETPPPLLSRIQDNDLWRFAHADTKEIMAAVFSYDYDFHLWDELMQMTLTGLQSQGVSIRRKHLKDIYEILKVATRRMNIGGHNVPVANLPYTMGSDAGHLLCQGEPFGAYYWDSPKGREFGLRSTDAGEDVSKIATLYGGGGHRNAAGFKVSFEKAQEFECTPL